MGPPKSSSTASAPKPNGASADRPGSALADEDAYSTRVAMPGARQVTEDVRSPVIACGPSAEVVNVLAGGVELMGGDNVGGGFL